MAATGDELTKYLWKHTMASAISKKYSTLENTRSLQVTSWNNDGTTQMFRCKCSFELTIGLKQKCLSITLYVHNCCRCCSLKTIIKHSKLQRKKCF